MSKSKATFVTVIMTAMLLAILAFLLLLDVKFAFFGICGIFALMGLVWADAILLGWLSEKAEEEILKPVEVKPVEDETEYTYDEIREDLEKEFGGEDV